MATKRNALDRFRELVFGLGPVKNVIKDIPQSQLSARVRATLPQAQQGIREARRVQPGNIGFVENVEDEFRRFPTTVPQRIRFPEPIRRRVEQIKAPVVRVPLQVGGFLAQEVARAPFRVAAGTLGLTGATSAKLGGRDVRPQEFLANIGTIGEGAVDLLTGGAVGATARLPLKGAIIKGLKTGAKLGAVSGAAVGLQQGRDEELLTQLLGAAGTSAVGSVLGAGIGGAIAPIGALIGKTVKVSKKFANSVNKSARSSFRLQPTTKSGQFKVIRRARNTQFGDKGEFKSQRGAIVPGEFIPKPLRAKLTAKEKIGDIVEYQGDAYKIDAQRGLSGDKWLITRGDGSQRVISKNEVTKLPGTGSGAEPKLPGAMDHRPSKTGGTVDDITKKGELIPEDFYTNPEFYSDVTDPAYRESIDALNKYRGKPNATITIYRASPVNELRDGDWVTLSKKYAEGESLLEKTPVNSFKVKANEVHFAGDDINEFGYFGKSIRAKGADPQAGFANLGEGIEGAKETGRKLLRKLKVVPQSSSKLRGFSESVQGASTVSDKTKELLPPSQFTTKENSQLMGEARALLEDGVRINFKGTDNLDQKVAATIQEAINLDKAGNSQAAANLFNNLQEQGTKLGRGVQAFAMLNKMSPESIALSVAGKINQFNRTAIKQIPKLQGEQLKVISDQVTQIAKLKGREKALAVNEMENILNSFIPSSAVDKAITLWKAGLLTSLRTHERNLLGNSIMAAAEIAKDIPARAADIALGAFTGERSITPTLRGSVSGLKGTRRQVKDIVTKGFDPGGQGSKFEFRKINWGTSKVGQGLKRYTDLVFNTLSAGDKPFFNSAFARSIDDQARTIAANTGKSADDLIASPTAKMVETATDEAAYATFHDKNVLTRIASGIKRIASNPKTFGNTRFSGAGAEAGKLVTEFTLPFTGVPGSIAGKTIAYSPLGLIKGVVKAGFVASGKVPGLQRQASQEIGRGVIGTGLTGIGAYLFNKGFMTGQPKDAEEARQWQLEGRQANSVMINGQWRSINSVGPQTLVFLAGAKAAEELGSPEGSVGALAGGLAKDQLSQTFLQGLFKPLQAINDPGRFGQSFVGSSVSSVVPNIVKDTSKAFDPNMRERNTTFDAVKASLPGVRNTLTPNRDVLGNVRPQVPTGAAAFVDLFNSRTPITNPVVDELSRLNIAGESATPSKLSKSQTIRGAKVKLTPQQLDILEKQSGGQISSALNQIVTSPGYLTLDDIEKKKLIDNTVSDIRKSVKAQLKLEGETEFEKPKATARFETSKDAPQNLMQRVILYGKGITKDPVSTINALFTQERLRKMRGDAVIFERQTNLSVGGGVIVDHIVPLSIGGSNAESNLQYLSEKSWRAKTVLEQKLYRQLESGEVNEKEAQQQIKAWAEQNPGTPITESGAKLVTNYQGILNAEDKVERFIDDGKTVKVDWGKIVDMPDGSNFDKALKEKALWKAVNKFASSSLDEGRKQALYEELGVTKEDADYYAIAVRDNDIKTARVLDDLAEIPEDQKIQALTTLRREINGEMILANGVIDNLFDEGLITKEEKKFLKSVEFGKDGESKVKPSTIKAKKPKKPKKLPKITISKGRARKGVRRQVFRAPTRVPTIKVSALTVPQTKRARLINTTTSVDEFKRQLLKKR